MSVLNWIVVAPLFVLFAVWTFSGVGAKRHIRGPYFWPREVGLRVVLPLLW